MVFGVVTSLHAIPISGSINIGSNPGGAIWKGDTANVNTISKIVSFGAVSVTSSAAINGVNTFFNQGVANGDLVTMKPLDFVTPFILNPLWSVDGFTFTLSPPISISRIDNPSPTPDTLRLSGTGTIKFAGFDDTMGGWTWSGQLDGTSTFTFSSTTIAAVPDGGMTVALLGAALSGLALLRRKLA